MKINGWLCQLFLGLFATYACSAQTPPPNDNYSNSIALTGTDLTFTGTLAGATIEGSVATGFRELDAYENTYGVAQPTQSVWWNWTAPASTVLTLQILSSSPGLIQNQGLDGFFIYTATNGSTDPSGLVLPAVGAKLIDFRLAPLSLSIPVTAGTNYQIQLIGNTSSSYTFRLVATNTPVIITQPRSQTVYSNASVLFYVVDAGIAPNAFTFQWCFNGTNISGETAPMLALTNIDGSMAGNYSVIVSNAAGYTISQPATLSVSQSNVPISLSVIGVRSNNFMFSLTGENGRNYRIESSTDLVNWAPEVSFPIAPYLPDTTSVVFSSNSPLVLAVTNNAAHKFYRATPYVIGNPDAEVCINNLRQVRIAKLLWQEDNANQEDPMFTPQYTDLLPYFPHQLAPFCPDDFTDSFFASYVIFDLMVEPRCNVVPATHVLEDPQ